MRHDDALRASVQCAVDESLVVLVDTYNRGHTPDIAGTGQVTQVCCIDGTMLTFQPDSIESFGSKGIDVVCMREATANKGGFSCFQLLTNAIWSHFYISQLIEGSIVSLLLLSRTNRQ